MASNSVSKQRSDSLPRADHHHYRHLHQEPGYHDINYSSIDNGNWTEWSPIRSVIVRVITKPRSGSPVCLITSMKGRAVGGSALYNYKNRLATIPQNIENHIATWILAIWLAIEARWGKPIVQQRRHNSKQLGFNFVFKIFVSVHKTKTWPKWGNRRFSLFWFKRWLSREIL